MKSFSWLLRTDSQGLIPERYDQGAGTNRRERSVRSQVLGVGCQLLSAERG